MIKFRAPYPVSRIPKSGFSLLEVLVAITVFVFVVAAAGGVFASIQQAWRRQRAAVNLIQNARWAMEFMTNQIRHTTVSVTPPAWAPIQPFAAGSRVAFGLDTNGDGVAETRVWYWRGNTASDTTGFGDRTFIYRGTGNNIAAAYPGRQQLANFIVDNPDLVNNGTGLPPADGLVDPTFILNNGLLTVELTLRPRPTVAVGRENRNYTLITQARPKNN